jgi:hypothetical protein
MVQTFQKFMICTVADNSNETTDGKEYIAWTKVTLHLVILMLTKTLV